MAIEVSTSPDTPTKAERLEARCRKVMAAIPKARGWDTQKVRAQELAYLDMLLDEYNAETRA